MENLKNNKNSKAKKITEIPRTSTIAEQTIMERHLNDDQYRKRMHEQKYTQTDLE